MIRRHRVSRAMRLRASVPERHFVAGSVAEVERASRCQLEVTASGLVDHHRADGLANEDLVDVRERGDLVTQRIQYVRCVHAGNNVVRLLVP